MRTWRLLLLSILAIALFLPGCGRRSTPPAPGRQVSAVVADRNTPVADFPLPFDQLKLPPPPPAPPTQPRAAEFTDTSGSMQGFTSTRSVALGTLHHEIDLAFSALGVGNAVDRFSVGETVVANRSAAPTFYQKPSSYNARQSRLDFIFAVKPTSPTAQNDPLVRYRYVLIVTDGMQASRVGPASGSGDGGCQQGADPYCLANLLASRISEDYGVWFMLVMMPFSGRHFSEQSMDETLWKRARDHVASVRADPFFVQADGQSVPFRVGDFRASADSSYSYVGVKPLLLIILSKDIPQGRRLIEKLEAAFKREKISPLRAGGVQSMEAAPFDLPGFQFAGIQRVEKKKASLSIINGAPVRSPQESHPLIVNLLVKPEDDTTFVLPLRTQNPPSTVLSPGVEPTLDVQANTDLRGMLTMGRDARGQYLLRLRGRLIPKGKHQVIITLSRIPTLTQDSSRVWWSLFSAQNNYEAPERLFGLEELVHRVCAKLLEKPIPAPQDYLVLNIMRS